MIDEKQFEGLSKFEDIFTKILDEKKRGIFIGKDSKVELSVLYKDITGQNAPCSGCAGTNWVKRMAKWYFKYKEEIETEVIEEKVEETPVEKPKRGRKKKTE